MNRIQLTVSTITALVGVAMLLRAAALDGSQSERRFIDTAPTPYSASHAIVQSRPGATEEQPDTF